ISRITVHGGGNGTISGNTIDPYYTFDSGFSLDIQDATHVDVTDSVIGNHANWSGHGGNLAVVNVDRSDVIHFEGDTIRSDNSPNCDHCGIVQVGNGSDVSFSDDYLFMPP